MTEKIGEALQFFRENNWHHRVMEFFYFTVVSSVGFLAGLFAGPMFIRLYGIGTWTAQGMMIVASTLVNFVCRKFFVFKG